MTKHIINFLKLSLTFYLIILLASCSKNKTLSTIEKGIFKKSQIEKEKKGLRIVPGDTLKSLSIKYKVTIEEIIKANNLKSPFILKPGKYLNMPIAKVYIIKKKDTFFSVARCFRISIKDIELKNKKLNAKKLKVGQIIYLPFYAKKNYCKKVKGKKDITAKRKQIIATKSIFLWPTKGQVIATFGLKSGGRRNDGINIKSPMGNPVRAALSGKVIYRGNELPAWGNLILIKHENGWTTAYAHLNKFIVKVGDEVSTGDLIGDVGKTGNVNDFQLHFQVRKFSKPLDPLKFLIRKND